MGGMDYPCISLFRLLLSLYHCVCSLEKEDNNTMSWQGWVFMLVVWGFVSGLLFYSFYRVLFDTRIQDRYEKKMKKEDHDH